MRWHRIIVITAIAVGRRKLMAHIFMAYMVTTLYSYGLCSHGLYSYGLCGDLEEPTVRHRLIN